MEAVNAPSGLDICLPPSAPDLLESMRAIGYSFEAAVADIVDNSIAAQATKIDIRFGAESGPYVAILDDGTGMSAAELVAAMRHGSSSPTRQSRSSRTSYGMGPRTTSEASSRATSAS